jgi:hypothetical protein
VETQRQWSDQAIARTTPVLLARMCSGGLKLLDPGDIWMLAIEVTRHRVH